MAQSAIEQLRTDARTWYGAHIVDAGFGEWTCNNHRRTLAQIAEHAINYGLAVKYDNYTNTLTITYQL